MKSFNLAQLYLALLLLVAQEVPTDPSVANTLGSALNRVQESTTSYIRGLPPDRVVEESVEAEPDSDQPGTGW